MQGFGRERAGSMIDEQPQRLISLRRERHAPQGAEQLMGPQLATGAGEREASTAEPTDPRLQLRQAPGLTKIVEGARAEAERQEAPLSVAYDRRPLEIEAGRQEGLRRHDQAVGLPVGLPVGSAERGAKKKGATRQRVAPLEQCAVPSFVADEQRAHGLALAGPALAEHLLLELLQEEIRACAGALQLRELLLKRG